MRETEFWARMNRHLGGAYAPTWADSVVLEALDGRTAAQALADGVPTVTVWRAVWAALELPASER